MEQDIKDHTASNAFTLRTTTCMHYGNVKAKHSADVGGAEQCAHSAWEFLCMFSVYEYGKAAAYNNV